MAALREPDAAPAGGGTSAPPTTSSDPSPCAQCHQRPRLGALSRCKQCIREAADAYRQARADAEARVEARKASTPAATKRCKACKQVKPISAFALHPRSLDGHRNACKPCVKKGFRTSKPRSAEQRGKAKAAAAMPEQRARNRQAVRAWSSRHPKASRARTMVHRALRKGLIARPASCQIAGCDVAEVVAHHSDYNAPLEVLFACRGHHRQLHSGVALRLKSDVPRKLARVPKAESIMIDRETKQAKRERTIVPIEELEQRRRKRDAAKPFSGSILEGIIIEEKAAR
jgi:hypothetical protein